MGVDTENVDDAQQAGGATYLEGPLGVTARLGMDDDGHRGVDGRVAAAVGQELVDVSRAHTVAVVTLVLGVHGQQCPLCRAVSCKSWTAEQEIGPEG